MDPNANLKESREIVARLLEGKGESDDSDRLAELFDGLDQWLSKGGYLPDAWRP